MGMAGMGGLAGMGGMPMMNPAMMGALLNPAMLAAMMQGGAMQGAWHGACGRLPAFAVQPHLNMAGRTFAAVSKVCKAHQFANPCPTIPPLSQAWA